MHKKKIIKSSVVIVLLVITFLFGFFYPIFGSYTLHGKRYADHVDDYLCSINWESFGDYEDYKYQYHHKTIAVWTAKSWVVTAEYTKENYEKQIKYIKENTKFMPEFITDGWNERKIRVQNKATINNWKVYVVAPNNEIDEYPKHIEMIAYNKDDSKIAYFDFEDSDLDSIDSLEIFISDYIHYRFK